MLKVLIVDDSRVTREVTKVYLAHPHIELLEARNGEDALKLIRKQPPDVVVADLQMPWMDGLALCAALGVDPALSAVPIVILTSNADPRSKQRCIEAGARDVLIKPVQPSVLIDAIRRQVGARCPL